MKNGTKALIAVLVVVVIAGGAYAIFHKSSTKPATSTTATVTPVNNAVIITKTDSTVGQYLADPSGKTLYVYGADTSGVSNCTGACLSAWPAYINSGATPNLPTGVSTITRTDNGQVQYTYNGAPLYYFASDPSGKVTGNNVQNFKVATPSASASSSSTTTPSSTTNSSSSSSSSGNPY